MKRRQVEQFFEKLGEQLSSPARIYLTGGVASWFWGGDRPTQDIDFGLQSTSRNMPKVEMAIQKVSKSLDIPVQFSEDISRWGTVGVANYKKKAKLYKKIGKLSVYLLDPAVWSIGKINRYYHSDIQDLRRVLKKQKLDFKKLTKLWVQALRESPRSSHHFLFIKTAEDFIRHYGKEIWGKRFSDEVGIAMFRSELNK